jgi:hypothetical protein
MKVRIYIEDIKITGDLYNIIYNIQDIGVKGRIEMGINEEINTDIIKQKVEADLVRLKSKIEIIIKLRDEFIKNSYEADI